MATKYFERLCDLTAKEIDRDRVSNPVLSGILERVTAVGYDGSFVFFSKKNHTDYKDSTPWAGDPGGMNPTYTEHTESPYSEYTEHTQHTDHQG